MGDPVIWGVQISCPGYRKIPYTAHLKTPAPKTILDMVFGTRVLKWAGYGPFGIERNRAFYGSWRPKEYYPKDIQVHIRMYMHTYIYIHVCAYNHIYLTTHKAHTCLYMRINIQTSMHMNTCLYTHIHNHFVYPSYLYLYLNTYIYLSIQRST